jgi:general secretion pathway protein A
VAGGAGKVTLTPRALAAVHGLSSGIPRLINLICDRALLAGYVRGTRVIEAAMVRQAATETVGVGRRAFDLQHYAALVVGLLVVAGVAYALAFPRPLSAPSGDAPAPATPPPTAPTRAVAPAALAPAALSSPATTPGLLEKRLLTLSRDSSYGAGAARILTLWGGSPVEKTTLRTHLPQLRRLDLPVLLEMFHPARRDTCFVALLGIEGDEAMVAVGDEPPSRLSLAELDRYWTRDAVFFWRDFDAVARQAEPDRTAVWVKAQLERLGYGADTKAAVLRFQQESDLIADGVVGSRTLMALYSRGPWPRPRLAAAGGGAS